MSSNKFKWKQACKRERVQRKLPGSRLECPEHGFFEPETGATCPIGGCGLPLKEV